MAPIRERPPNSRLTRPTLRVLYTSGYPLDIARETEGEMVRREIRELLAAFIPKPFTPTSLAENVRKVLEEMPV